MTPLTPYIDGLQAAAENLAAQETAFRRETAERIKVLERERAFAFRKFNLMRSVADGVANAEDEEKAIGATTAILCSRLDWTGGNESQREALDRFAAVARAVFACSKSAEPSQTSAIGAALNAFETWYESVHRVPFWALFEQPMVETPRVDF
jgi:hypothetical protein